MNKNVDIKNEVMNLYAEDYAKDEGRWKESLSLLAALYVQEFKKNIDFMTKQLKNIMSLSTKSSDEDFEKYTPIFRAMDVRKNIENDKESRRYFVNTPHFKEYSLVKDKKEIKAMNNAVEQLDNETRKTNGTSFRQLDMLANFIISFINEESVRKGFYANVIARPDSKLNNADEIINSVPVSSLFSPKEDQLLNA